MSSAVSQYTSGTLKPLMSMPMICCAATRASSGLFASLMPPALPRPPTGTCAFTATGPSLAHAAAASSGVRATAPGGMRMTSVGRTSLAWYSRSFTLLRRLERAGCLRVLRVVVPAVAEALAERAAVDEDHPADHQHDHDEQRKSAADQDRRQRGDAAARRRLSDRPPYRSVPVLQTVVGDPCSIRVLSRHQSVTEKSIGGGSCASRCIASSGPWDTRTGPHPGARSRPSGRWRWRVRSRSRSEEHTSEL